MTPDQSSISARYTIEGALGKGSMGVVYRAFDRLTQQPIALKRVFIDPADVQHNSIGDDPLFALAVEFRTLASLHHPNIIPVLDYGFDANRAPYYTMMLLDGARSLLDYGRSLDDAGKVRLLNNLLRELKALLPVDTLASLMAEGSTLDLEATAREWLGRLEALQL